MLQWEEGPEAASRLGLRHGAGPFEGGDAVWGVAQLGEDGARVVAALRRGRAESCGRHREQRRRPDVVNDAEARMLPCYHKTRLTQERILVEVGDGADEGDAHARRGQHLGPRLPRACGEEAGEGRRQRSIVRHPRFGVGEPGVGGDRLESIGVRERPPGRLAGAVQIEPSVARLIEM